MRQLTLQTSQEMTLQSRGLTAVVKLVDEVAGASQRSSIGLAEQAKGATEVAKAVEELRRTVASAGTCRPNHRSRPKRSTLSAVATVDPRARSS